MIDARKQYIEESANYLREKRIKDELFAGTVTDDSQALSKREELIGKVTDAHKQAARLRASLEPLEREIQIDGLPNNFSLLEEHLKGAWRQAINLEVRLSLALQEGTPKGRTKSKVYHQAAARLAVAFDDRSARQLAHDIIKAVGDLDTDYSEQSMDNWLRAARREIRYPK